MTIFRYFVLLFALTSSYAIAASIQSAEKLSSGLEDAEQRISTLAVELNGSGEERKRIIRTRLRREEMQHTQLLHDYAEIFLSSDLEVLPEADLTALQGYLALEPALIRNSLTRAMGQVTLPGSGLTPQEVVARATSLESLLKSSSEMHEQLFRNLALSRRAGMNVEAEEVLLNQSTLERAENASAYLVVVMDDVNALETEAAILPENKDLQALYRVHKKLLEIVVAELEAVTGSLDALGEIDTTRYRSQIVTASGSLSHDVFNVGVFSTLMSGWVEYFAGWVGLNGLELMFNLLTFVVIVLVSRTLSRWLKKLVEKALALSNAHMSTLLKRMIISTAATSVYVIGLLIALSQIGFSLGPLLAGLGIAGFVIGFALQDTLSNFASGLMILFYRPFDVGDVIDSSGVFGEVSNMSLVNTTILTFDNQTLIVPNSNIWGNVIKNVTAQKKRRVDFMFGIGYGDDIPKAEKVLWDILTSHEKILPDPEALVKIHELGESSVNIAVRPWVNTADYWDVYWDITRTVKMRFDEEGISIPFPQRDLHIIKDD